MNALADYMERERRSPEQVASTLHALTGKTISAQGVKMWAARKDGPPKAWREALQLDGAGFLGDSATGDPPSDGDERLTELPPRPLADSKIAPTTIPGFARKRIAATYGYVGSGLGMALGNEGVGLVWADSSDPIAQAWLQAAETSDFARKFVTMMTAGGPMGEVVMLHVMMLGGTLYCLGQFPEVGLYGQYKRYRPQPRSGPGLAATQPAGRADDNGAPPIATGDFMDEPAGEVAA